MAYKHLRDRIGTTGWKSHRQMTAGMPGAGAGRGNEKSTLPPGAVPITGGAASPGGTPMAMPLARVVVGPTTSQYVTVGMEDLTPIWTADGAGIPASASGSWGQVTAAANPREGAQRATAARAQRYNDPAPATPAAGKGRQ
jgi:hypothetical protein